MLTARSDVRDLVLQGVDFRVVSANTDEDLTGSILLQIIVELESVDEPLFTTEILSEVIRFYGDTVQTAFTDYLERSLALFAEQQKAGSGSDAQCIHRQPCARNDGADETQSRDLE